VRDTLHARALESVALLYLNGTAVCPRTQEMQTRLEFGSILQAVPTTYARAFASAAEILGGAEALNSAALLRSWSKLIRKNLRRKNGIRNQRRSSDRAVSGSLFVRRPTGLLIENAQRTVDAARNSRRHASLLRTVSRLIRKARGRSPLAFRGTRPRLA